MLWLASLIGIVGAGATSLVLPQTQADQDETPNGDDCAGQTDETETTGDLFNFEEVEEEGFTDDNASPFYLHEDFLTQEFAVADDPEVVDSEVTKNDIFASEITEGSAENELGMMQAAPVALGDWIMEGPPAEVLEYEAETESLMLVWDDLVDGAHEPDVRVEQDPDDTQVMHVVMNDYSVAEVHGDPDLRSEDVTIIPLSSALIVGLEPA